jgi:hypothetical protein
LSQCDNYRLMIVIEILYKAHIYWNYSNTANYQ